jgi:DNA mismatch endonuclease, patch repair protein
MDNLTPSQRSETMRAVKAKDTSPELTVRRLCRELGEPGYRLHRRDIPGSPDLAYPGRRLAVFVHGCFWHGHDCKAGSKVAKTNSDYWSQKIGRNSDRDARRLTELREQGWKTLVVLECELRHEATVRDRLARFLRRK